MMNNLFYRHKEKVLFKKWGGVSLRQAQGKPSPLDRAVFYCKYISSHVNLMVNLFEIDQYVAHFLSKALSSKLSVFFIIVSISISVKAAPINLTKLEAPQPAPN